MGRATEMRGPSVTVLMALYNGGEYLKQSVQSVLGQTYGHFEFLIINDCSTDNSLETIESFHDERINVHTNAKNVGQTKSLNLGLELAQGDYIARIDGDDVALPQWLKTQVEYIKKYPQHSVISSYAIAIDEDNKIRKLYKPPRDTEDIILRSLITSPIHHVGSILKKKDIVKAGSYDERYVFAADYELWERLIRKGFKITTTPKILVAIREHAHSVSRSEQSNRDLEEIKEIAGKNIGQFISAKFSGEEIGLFCRANYDEGNLTEAEFNTAIDVTKRVYMNVGPSLGVKNRKKIKWMRQRCRTIYLKRIFFFITRKDYAVARRLSLKAMKEFGPLSIFMMLWAMSLAGGLVLSLISGFYKKVLRANARIQLGIQPNIRIFR